MSDEQIVKHPVQTKPRYHDGAKLREEVVLRAYEVYCHVWGPQPAMVDVAKGCRSGFSAGELIAYLYAYPFPKSEWSARVDFAHRGMEQL